MDGWWSLSPGHVDLDLVEGALLPHEGEGPAARVERHRGHVGPTDGPLRRPAQHGGVGAQGVHIAEADRLQQRAQSRKEVSSQASGS